MPETFLSAENSDASKILLFWQDGQCCAIPADRVVKVVASQPLTILPFLPKPVLGVIAVGGKVVPVLDLHTMLGLPEADQSTGELVLVATGAETYALRVDHVLQIAAPLDHWRDSPVRFIDVDDLMQQGLRGGAAALTGFASLDVTRLNTGPNPSAVDDQTTVLGVRGAALAVETASSYEFLPLDLVVELSETLPVADVPDPSPLFAGAAFFRDALLPVICLDALLGRTPAAEDARNAFIVVEIDGRRCALAVKQMIGLVPEAEPESVVDLRLLLENLLPAPDSANALTAPQAPQARATEADPAETRYLLVELAGQICAVALTSVAHIHAECRVLQAPARAQSVVAGVTAIGGRVLPVLDLAALLGLVAGPAMPHFIELKSAHSMTFIVAVDRVAGIIGLRQDALVPPPEACAITAVARLGGDLVWILDAALIAEHSGWRSDAA